MLVVAESFVLQAFFDRSLKEIIYEDRILKITIVNVANQV